MGEYTARRLVVDGAAQEGRAEFIDQMAQALGERGSVLVVHPSWSTGGAGGLIALARGALHTDRIAAVPLDLPPLALSLVADQLAFVAPHVPPGRLAGLASRLSVMVCAGAWLHSVARLENVPVGLAEHAVSYLPGRGGFSVLAAPSPGVHRITRAEPVQAIERPRLGPVLLAAADQNGDPGWLRESLQGALGATSIVPAAVQPLSDTYWGSRRHTEFVAFSGHPDAVQQAVTSAGGRPCGWCGEPTALPECSFCGMAVRDGSGDVSGGAAGVVAGSATRNGVR
ncbi:hypothetical protein [Actinomadura rugatobispora]